MYNLDAVRRAYGGTLVLNDVTCTIPTNALVVLLGPSGSGKSTLLRHLCFIETPDSGRISLELGETMFLSSDMKRPWPRATLVFQQRFLWPHLTLLENITLPLQLRGVANVEGRLQQVVDLFDMSAFIRRYPNEVSGGQAQRVALARALVLDPQLILIDEAHTGLDLEQQELLNAHLVALRARGVGLIVVSHSLRFARRFGDHVVVIEAGVVTESGEVSVMDAPTSRYLRKASLLVTEERDPQREQL